MWPVEKQETEKYFHIAAEEEIRVHYIVQQASSTGDWIRNSQSELQLQSQLELELKLELQSK